MVVLGGLEIVVGGYLVHRYHKSKNEKKRLQEEAHQRRHNTFPGARPQSYPQQQEPMMPQQKYACYAPQPHPQFQPRPHTAQPHPHPQTEAFTVPRRPVPQPQPHFQQQIQPLQRADSFATLSNMPVANGSRYQDDNPPLPPRRQPPNLQPMPQQQPINYPYYNTGFSTSYSSFEPSSTTPVAHPTNQQSGTHTVDDNWEAYGTQSAHVHFAVSASPQPGEREDDPPPPYRP